MDCDTLILGPRTGLPSRIRLRDCLLDGTSEEHSDRTVWSGNSIDVDGDLLILLIFEDTPLGSASSRAASTEEVAVLFIDTPTFTGGAGGGLSIVFFGSGLRRAPSLIGSAERESDNISSRDEVSLISIKNNTIFYNFYPFFSSYY